MYVGADNQVGMALPHFQLMFLRGAHSATHYLKNVGGLAAISFRHPDGYADHIFRAHISRSLCGNGSHQSAIYEPARADFYRLKNSRKGATGANRIDHIAFGENHGFSAI